MSEQEFSLQPEDILNAVSLYRRDIPLRIDVDAILQEYGIESFSSEESEDLADQLGRERELISDEVKQTQEEQPEKTFVNPYTGKDSKAVVGGGMHARNPYKLGEVDIEAYQDAHKKDAEEKRHSITEETEEPGLFQDDTPQLKPYHGSKDTYSGTRIGGLKDGESYMDAIDGEMPERIAHARSKSKKTITAGKHTESDSRNAGGSVSPYVRKHTLKAGDNTKTTRTEGAVTSASGYKQIDQVGFRGTVNGRKQTGANNVQYSGQRKRIQSRFRGHSANGIGAATTVTVNRMFAAAIYRQQHPVDARRRAQARRFQEIGEQRGKTWQSDSSQVFLTSQEREQILTRYITASDKAEEQARRYLVNKGHFRKGQAPMPGYNAIRPQYDMSATGYAPMFTDLYDVTGSIRETGTLRGDITGDGGASSKSVSAAQQQMRQARQAKEEKQKNSRIEAQRRVNNIRTQNANARRVADYSAYSVGGGQNSATNTTGYDTHGTAGNGYHGITNATGYDTPKTLSDKELSDQKYQKAIDDRAVEALHSKTDGVGALTDNKTFLDGISDAAGEDTYHAKLNETIEKSLTNRAALLAEQRYLHERTEEETRRSVEKKTDSRKELTEKRRFRTLFKKSEKFVRPGDKLKSPGANFRFGGNNGTDGSESAKAFKAIGTALGTSGFGMAGSAISITTPAKIAGAAGKAGQRIQNRNNLYEQSEQTPGPKKKKKRSKKEQDKLKKKKSDYRPRLTAGIMAFVLALLTISHGGFSFKQMFESAPAMAHVQFDSVGVNEDPMTQSANGILKSRFESIKNKVVYGNAYGSSDFADDGSLLSPYDSPDLWQGPKYNFTDAQVRQLANLCNQENGSYAGVMWEACLMLNHYELQLFNNSGNKTRYLSYQNKADGIMDMVRNDSWWASAGYFMDNGSASQEQINRVKQVLEGKRVIPLYIDEHDCFGDIEGGSASAAAGWVPNSTVLHNDYDSTYTFYGQPDGQGSGSDPFGYTQAALAASKQHVSDPYNSDESGVVYATASSVDKANNSATDAGNKSGTVNDAGAFDSTGNINDSNAFDSSGTATDSGAFSSGTTGGTTAVGGSAAGSASGTYTGTITTEVFVQECKKVMDMAREQGWRYGNSVSNKAPCDDGIISCDRMVARALWNLGLQDQPMPNRDGIIKRTGCAGITVGNVGEYLKLKGWSESFSASDIRYGSVINVKHVGHSDWTHTFVCLEYDPVTKVTSRFDAGCNERIQSVQPLKNQPWGYSDNIAVYNLPDSGISGNGLPDICTYDGSKNLPTINCSKITIIDENGNKKVIDERSPKSERKELKEVAKIGVINYKIKHKYTGHAYQDKTVIDEVETKSEAEAKAAESESENSSENNTETDTNSEDTIVVGGDENQAVVGSGGVEVSSGDQKEAGKDSDAVSDDNAFVSPDNVNGDTVFLQEDTTGDAGAGDGEIKNTGIHGKAKPGEDNMPDILKNRKLIPYSRNNSFNMKVKQELFNLGMEDDDFVIPENVLKKAENENVVSYSSHVEHIDMGEVTEEVELEMKEPTLSIEFIGKKRSNVGQVIDWPNKRTHEYEYNKSQDNVYPGIKILYDEQKYMQMLLNALTIGSHNMDAKDIDAALADAVKLGKKAKSFVFLSEEDEKKRVEEVLKKQEEVKDIVYMSDFFGGIVSSNADGSEYDVEQKMYYNDTESNYWAKIGYLQYACDLMDASFKAIKKRGFEVEYRIKEESGTQTWTTSEGYTAESSPKYVVEASVILYVDCAPEDLVDVSKTISGEDWSLEDYQLIFDLFAPDYAYFKEFYKLSDLVRVQKHGAFGGNAGSLPPVCAIIYNYLHNKGLSDICIAGILGNMAQEVGGGKLETINPDLHEHTDEPGGGYGLIQWTNYPKRGTVGRKANLINFAISRGVINPEEHIDIMIQLDFMWEEIFATKGLSTEPSEHWHSFYSSFMNSKTPEDAAHFFLIGPEAGGEETYRRYLNTWYEEEVRKPEAARAYAMMKNGGFAAPGQVTYENQGNYSNVSFNTRHSDYGSSATVQTSGCGICSITMVLNYFGRNVTVPQIAAIGEANDSYNPVVDTNAFANFASEFGAPAPQHSNSPDEAKAALGNKGIVIVHVPGHYYVICGLNGDYVGVFDPGRNERTELGRNATRETMSDIISGTYEAKGRGAFEYYIFQVGSA